MKCITTMVSTLAEFSRQPGLPPSSIRRNEDLVSNEIGDVWTGESPGESIPTGIGYAVSLPKDGPVIQ